MTPALGRLTPRRSVIGLAMVLASVGAIAGSPARAEDSLFWEIIRAMGGGSGGGYGYAPAPPPGWYSRPRVRRAAPRVRPAPPSQMANLPAADAKPPDPDKRPNPLTTLLGDPTLRRGDIVMFPDGARVFMGEPGARHAMADFVQVSRTKGVDASTRKLVAALPVGQNNAWSSAAAAAKGQIAQGNPDVETTGSLAKERARR